ncbi:MAG: deoxyuridine 5'-triphosphate nucleotidohydrolase [Candidatus Jordarchaeales archaeon]|nr:deoxyuridine 5'-triphosphate nucleotidohydrolase [Candidatus Jordarchaeia archaeon]
MFECGLSGHEVRKLILEHSLVSDYLDLNVQVTSNGFDLSLRDVYSFNGPGRVDFSNAGRLIPDAVKLNPEGNVYSLKPGAYKVVFNEVLNLPRDIFALGFPRSSLLRCGVTVHCAVFDAGYHGRSESLMTVSNPYGFILEKNARIVQLVFFRLSEPSEGYKGKYLGENL